MTYVGFLFLFVLNIVLFSCKGQVVPPSNDSIVFLPAATERIEWTFKGDASKASLFWYFTKRGGSKEEDLAARFFNGPPRYFNSSLPGVAIEDPATLVLKNVDERYNGKYRLLVTLSGGGGESIVDVFIAAKPNVTFTCDSRNEVNEGDNFTCVCKGENGNPPANVTWYKDGVQISTIGTKSKTLTLINVNETSNGTYKCEAQTHANDSFADEKSINVIVRQLTEPNITSFTVTPGPVVKEGERVTITCISKGVPAPNNTIMRNGIKIIAEKTSTNVNTEKTSTEVSTDITSTTYTINSVKQLDDAGIYTCIAKNKIGNDSATLNLTVQGQITPTPTPTTPTPSTSYAATSSIPSNGTEPAPTITPRTTPPSSAPTSSSTGGLSTGAIIGIIIGVLVLIIIVVVVVVYYCKSKEKERSNNRANIDPVPGNSHELGEPGAGDGAYDTVWPVGTSGSKSKAPVENTLPPVYAAVDKNNREGNTLYASLDDEALKSSRASKKEPGRPQQTEYASIDFAKTGNAPKAV